MSSFKSFLAYCNYKDHDSCIFGVLSIKTHSIGINDSVSRALEDIGVVTLLTAATSDLD